MAVEARRLADELGLTGVHVFFNEEWVPYDQRQNFLLDADVAVTTHFHHVETDFSFRTRVLDYLWATLPTVTTNGDSLADLIERRGLGLTVPPEDVDALADALFTLLDDTGPGRGLPRAHPRDRARAGVGRDPAAAGRVLPGTPPGARPHGGPGRRRPTARTPPSSPRRPGACGPTSRSSCATSARAARCCSCARSATAPPASSSPDDRASLSPELPVRRIMPW